MRRRLLVGIASLVTVLTAGGASPGAASEPAPRRDLPIRWTTDRAAVAAEEVRLSIGPRTYSPAGADVEISELVRTNRFWSLRADWSRDGLDHSLIISFGHDRTEWFIDRVNWFVASTATGEGDVTVTQVGFGSRKGTRTRLGEDLRVDIERSLRGESLRCATATSVRQVERSDRATVTLTGLDISVAPRELSFVDRALRTLGWVDDGSFGDHDRSCPPGGLQERPEVIPGGFGSTTRDQRSCITYAAGQENGRPPSPTVLDQTAAVIEARLRAFGSTSHIIDRGRSADLRVELHLTGDDDPLRHLGTTRGQLEIIGLSGRPARVYEVGEMVPRSTIALNRIVPDPTITSVRVARRHDPLAPAVNVVLDATDQRRLHEYMRSHTGDQLIWTMDGVVLSTYTIGGFLFRGPSIVIDGDADQLHLIAAILRSGPLPLSLTEMRFSECP